jgi:hypothetical protein
MSNQKGGQMSMDWQPIETAPLDGSKVIILLNGHVTVGDYSVREHFENGKSVYRNASWRVLGMYWPGEEPAPTHWMPLPKAPAVAQGD